MMMDGITPLPGKWVGMGYGWVLPKMSKLQMYQYRPMVFAVRRTWDFCANKWVLFVAEALYLFFHERYLSSGFVFGFWKVPGNEEDGSHSTVTGTKRWKGRAKRMA
jgi:hypothetical protein